jgi:hypothetical protein
VAGYLIAAHLSTESIGNLEPGCQWLVNACCLCSCKGPHPQHRMHQIQGEEDNWDGAWRGGDPPCLAELHYLEGYVVLLADRSNRSVDLLAAVLRAPTGEGVWGGVRGWGRAEHDGVTV